MTANTPARFHTALFQCQLCHELVPGLPAAQFTHASTKHMETSQSQSAYCPVTGCDFGRGIGAKKHTLSWNMLREHLQVSGMAVGC